MGMARGSRSRIGSAGALAAVAAALALVSGGCFDPTFPEGKVACKVTADCPPDFACSSGLCFHLGEDGAVVPGTGTGGASGHDGGAGTGGSAGQGGGAGRGGSGGAGRGGSGGAGRDAGTDAAGDGGCAANLCALGDHRCGTNGLATCVAVGNCMTWSSDMPCTGRKTCQGAAPSAACKCPAAPAGCTGAGQSCVSGALVTCAVDGDSCIYPATSTTCPTSEPCGGSFPSAVCTCPAKPAACTNGQAGTFCDATNKNVITCAVDANKCLTVTGQIACTSAPCTGTVGAATCGTCPAAPAECTQSGKVCAVNGQLETCGLDSNGCMANLGALGCGSPQTCQGALPNATCTCPTAPAVCMNQVGKVCSSTGSTTVVTCGMTNGCLTTTGTKTCPSPQTCMGSLPSADCACPTVAACQSGTAGSYCDSSNGNLVTCTEDGNSCFSAASGPCASGLVCSGSFPSGKCVCPSVPNCPTAGKSCSGTTLVTCTQDTQGCLHEADTNCASSGLVCSMVGTVNGCNCPAPTGGCGSTPSKTCSADNMLFTCAANTQGCIQGSTTTCGSGQYCWTSTTACAAPTAVGYPTDLGGTENLGTGALAGEAITIGVTSTVRSFGLLAPAAGSMVSMGLYSDVGGVPSQLLMSAQSKGVLSGTNTYAPTSAQAGGSLQIPPGTYWIAALYDVTTTIRATPVGGAMTTFKGVTTNFGALPTSLSSGSVFTQAGRETNYYILITQ